MYVYISNAFETHAHLKRYAIKLVCKLGTGHQNYAGVFSLPDKISFPMLDLDELVSGLDTNQILHYLSDRNKGSIPQLSECSLSCKLILVRVIPPIKINRGNMSASCQQAKLLFFRLNFLCRKSLKC